MSGRPAVLMLSPEPPYPLHGGGAYRTASLLHYFAGHCDVDLVLISDSGKPALLPPGLVRSQQVIPLRQHSKTPAARVLRNAGRALRGVPPLMDRMAGLSTQIIQAIGERRYDLGIVEHFWCAEYIDTLDHFCRRLILDLHNVESTLHRRCAACTSSLAIKAGHLRFASACLKRERRLLPKYSDVLTTSSEDAELVSRTAPSARVNVYPNALPWVEIPSGPEQNRIVFSGNFEYHPNIDAVEFLIREIWPSVRKRHPELELWLVGRGDEHIKHLLSGLVGIHTTGPVESALNEISKAIIVLVPLRSGSGTRIKILEAWSAARAVIATPMGAEGLNAINGEYLVLAQEAGEFGEAIDRLLADSACRTRLGAKGRETFEFLYTWPAAWSKLDLVLQNTPLARPGGYTEII